MLQIQPRLETLTGDPLKIMLNYDQWATQRLLDVFGRLRDEQLDQSFHIGIGTLRRTLIHVICNMEYWYDRAVCHPEPRFNPPRAPTLVELAERHERVWAHFAELINTSPADHLTDIIVSEFRDDDGSSATVRFPRSAVLLHVFNHGTHHRSQCLNMLRQLGVDPLPEIDLIDSMQALVTTRPAPPAS